MATRGFTLACGQDVFSIEKIEQPRPLSGSGLSGKQARDFYEKLTKDDKGARVSSNGSLKRDNGIEPRDKRRDINSSRARRRRARAAELHLSRTDSVMQRSSEGAGNQRETSRPNSERFTELLGLRLLRCAHEGDTSGLKDLLSKGVDVNFQDTYLWTAIMCASWTGQRAAVRLLLQHGAAWVGVVDAQGRDAQALALEAGHTDVLEELESYGRSTQRDTNSDDRVTQPPQWCDKCRTTYTSSPSSHLSSTLHQFSVRHPLPTPYYCLPPSSNSYKMMVRCGWKPGTGLGPDGEGPKQPVPTVLKRDQKGLGYGHMKRAKVTHFQARDHDAVKPPSKEKEERGGKGQRKEESRRKEQRDKNWERDFRVSFYL